MRSVNLITHSARLHIVLLLALGSAISFAQNSDSLRVGTLHHDHFFISGRGDSVYSLPHRFVINGSERVRIDTILLQPSIDYILDTRVGTLKISPVTLRADCPDTLRHSLDILYRALPFDFKPVYRLHETFLRIDTATGERQSVVQPGRSFSVDDLFGSNLQKSGSLVRGFSVGSNRDLSLTSGFRMQMSGNITDDLQLVAALTDENSPIQPEGTTQTLQEVDKVFIQLRGNEVRATLGDFDLNLAGSEFGVLTRKLEGAEGSYRYQGGSLGSEILLSGAAPRGKYASNQFLGLDGVQGPYELVGQNNERAILVIAGTERVYVNGESMTRGEVNDYTIDYSNAEITFATRRLISRSSRITVDFEYSDRQYNRTFVAAQSQTTLADDKASLTVTAVQESDNENSPIDASLSSSDLDTLRAAGDDQRKASRDGVTFVGAGKGQYSLAGTFHDTSAGRNAMVPVYKFNPVDTLNAVYSIVFSFVGPGNGYYRKITTLEYQFDSLRQGSYEPIRYLPMPQSHALVDINVKASPMEHLQVTGEYSASKLDPNKFSPINDDHHNGGATSFGLLFSPSEFRIGGANLGSLDLRLKERYINRLFVPLDRTDDVEFNRKWNLPDTSGEDQELHEGQLTYRPVKSVVVGSEIGQLNEGQLSTSRYSLSGQILNGSIRDADYHFEDVMTSDPQNDLRASWLRESGTLQHTFGFLVPRLRYSHELLLNHNEPEDTLRQGSYQFNEIVPGLMVGSTRGASLSADVGWQWDDSLAVESLLRASHTFLQQYSGRLQGGESFSTLLDLTLQKRSFTETFRERNNDDVNALLLRSQTHYAPLSSGIESDLYYEAGTERTQKLERVFQQVPKGTGNYIYLGDVNGNHVVDPDDFQLSRFDGEYVLVTVPTDELLPVIDVKTSVRLRLTPSRFLDGSSWPARAASIFSTETYFRVDEKNTDPDTKQIYLLHFSHFLNDQTTLAGTNIFTQDVYLLENHPEFNMRLRFNQQKGLTAFATSNERTYTREQSFRLRWQFMKELANQIDYAATSNNLTANEPSDRVRKISSDNLQWSWTYRPEQDVEVVFGFGVGKATNFDTTNVRLDNQTIRCTYGLGETGQVAAEFTRQEAIFSSNPALVPFELTDGWSAGKSWLWRISWNHQITHLLQATAQYDGRSEGGGAAIHTARAEVRAMF